MQCEISLTKECLLGIVLKLTIHKLYLRTILVIFDDAIIVDKNYRFNELPFSYGALLFYLIYNICRFPNDLSTITYTYTLVFFRFEGSSKNLLNYICILPFVVIFIGIKEYLICII